MSTVNYSITKAYVYYLYSIDSIEYFIFYTIILLSLFVLL